MTVLIGIKCSDGIVIGSDSSATFSSGNISTIEQRTKKIEILHGKIIVAGTGHVGLGQCFCNQIDQGYAAGRFKSQNAIQTGVSMSELGIADFTLTGAPKGQYGALVAYPTGPHIHLCEFGCADFQPEQKTEHMWYASMGSGQLIADPFLGLMRSVYWRGGMPNLQDGIFIASWAIQHVIEVNTGGVGGDVQMATLSNTSTGPVARLLLPDELAEHRENVEGAMEHLRCYMNRDTTSSAPAIPMPPAVAN